jgi:hypothetical protein
MKRRDLLSMIAAATGTAFVGSNVLAYTVMPIQDSKDSGYSNDEVAFFNEVGEIIIPRTDSPGAKDANVGSIMSILLADCYSPVQQKAVKIGIESLRSKAKTRYAKDFLLLTHEQRIALLSSIDEEADMQNKKTVFANSSSNENELMLPHYFTIIKQLVLFSFFSSEVGATKVLRYEAIPGSYDGDLPYKKGDKAWAT